MADFKFLGLNVTGISSSGGRSQSGNIRINVFGSKNQKKSGKPSKDSKYKQVNVKVDDIITVTDARSIAALRLDPQWEEVI